MLSITRRPAPEPDPDRQYALLMVSEEQLNQLMRREAVRQVNRRLVRAEPSYVVPPVRRARRTMGAMLALVALALVAGAWLWTPRTALAARLPWAQPAVAPMLLTGASFSVAVASPRSADAAGAVIGRLHGMGLPAFASTRENGSGGAGTAQSYQVMVGPYVSLEEAERLQRRLEGAGFANPRVAVDESLRHAGPGVGHADGTRHAPGMVLVNAPGRLSLALEMAHEPRQVTSRRVDGTTFDVEVGPIASAVDSREWRAPAGVHLLHHVSVQEQSAGGEARHLHARLSIPEFARASVRVEGPRVYVDLTWPSVAGEIVPSPPAAVAAAAAPPVAPVARSVVETPAHAVTVSIQPLLAAIERFEEIAPFLLSAAASPSPEVMGALDTTVASVQRSLQTMRVPREAAAGHGILIAAAAAARRGLGEEFGGDRIAQAQQAVGLFESGRLQVSASPAAR